VLSQVSIPVYLGVNVYGESVDPERLDSELADQGFDGVVNFPSCIHHTASMQRILERGGRGVTQEGNVLVHAKKLGLKSIFYCSAISLRFPLSQYRKYRQ